MSWKGSKPDLDERLFIDRNSDAFQDEKGKMWHIWRLAGYGKSNNMWWTLLGYRLLDPKIWILSYVIVPRNFNS